MRRTLIACALALTALAPSVEPAIAAQKPVVKGHAAVGYDITYAVPVPAYDDTCHTLWGTMGGSRYCWGSMSLTAIFSPLRAGTVIDTAWTAHIVETFACAKDWGSGARTNRTTTIEGDYSDTTLHFTDPDPVRANGDLRAGAVFGLNSPNPNGQTNPDGSSGITFPCGYHEIPVRTGVTITNVKADLRLRTGGHWLVDVPGTYTAGYGNFH